METKELIKFDFINFQGYVLVDEFGGDEGRHTSDTLSLYNQGLELEIFSKLGDEDYYEGVSISCGVPYFQFYIDGNTVYVGTDGEIVQ